MTLTTVKSFIRQVAAAKESLRAEVALTFPVGAEVHWDKYGHRQHGTVLDHGGIGRCAQLRVENERTGNRYWVSMYDVLGYVE